MTNTLKLTKICLLRKSSTSTDRRERKHSALSVLIRVMSLQSLGLAEFKFIDCTEVPDFGCTFLFLLTQ